MGNTTPDKTGKSFRGWMGQAWAVALVLSVMVLVPPAATSEIDQALQPDGTLSVTNVPTDRRYHPLPFGATWIGTRISQRELEQAIAWYARQYRLHPALLRAVIKAESDFDPAAVSRTGAQGLMQLMPRTAASLKVRDPFNPIENIRGGAKHLRYLLDRFNGDLTLALAAYNAGEYRVKRHQQVPPIRETRFYVKQVLTYYHAYRTGKVQPAYR
jgi:soluble lytic murein transglycosylase